MKAMGSVLVAGGMHASGMYEKWKAAGARAQVLRWIKEGGYTIQVGEDRRGIFRRDSVTTREHNAELVTLVLEVLIKKPWKVAREGDLRSNGNILPMGLALSCPQAWTRGASSTMGASATSMSARGPSGMKRSRP